GLPVRVQFLGVASHRHHRKGEVLVPVGVGRGVGGRVVGRTTDLAPLHEADITRGEQVLQSFITFRTLASNTKKHRPWPVWKRPTGPCSARPRSVPPPPSKKHRSDHRSPPPHAEGNRCPRLSNRSVPSLTGWALPPPWLHTWSRPWGRTPPTHWPTTPGRSSACPTSPWNRPTTVPARIWARPPGPTIPDAWP